MIYFIKEEEKDYVYIGYTHHEVNIDKCLKQLQNGNPRKLYVFKKIEGGFNDANKIKKNFHDFYVRDSWYIFNEDMIKPIVKEIKQKKKRAKNPLNLLPGESETYDFAKKGYYSRMFTGDGWKNEIFIEDGMKKIKITRLHLKE